MPKKKSKPATKVAYSESDSEYDDEIQTHHKQRDKILLDSDQEDVDDTEEEEVYGIDESDSEDEEIAQMQQQLRQIKRNKIKKKLGSDLEDDTEDEAVPDSRAWGSKKSWFMGGDVRDNKIILSGDEDEAGAAALEEKEMREIEKRQLERMTEEDYLPPSLMMMLKGQEKKEKNQEKKQLSEGSDAVEEEPEETKGKKKKDKKKETKKKKSSAESGTDELEKIQIQTDFSKLPKEAEFEKIKEMHPEFMPLYIDFGQKMRELQDRIIPLMGLVKKGKVEGLGATYLRMKFHIICNYLICGGFYMYFMSKRTPRLHHHPVMKRLLELQQFYNRLVPLDKRVKTDLDKVLDLVQKGKDVGKVLSRVPDEGEATQSTSKKKARKAKQEDGPAAKKRKVQFREEPEVEEEEELEEDDTQLGDLDDADDDDNEDEQGRRAITYEMEKNKGLTAHKKKELKNPRVKHRKKYRRALIRRKGQVRDFKPPKQAYTGEMTGIRAGIIRSRKLK
ncbi:something about silencing protein 10-like [Babylonia areolata]|uniref:something about silencing protein 10-like n=1 Tax=Babylonia areolata TaxID=304850 RepID=UPI003FD45646